MSANLLAHSTLCYFQKSLQSTLEQVFVYYKYMNRHKKQLLKKALFFKQQFTKHLNGKYQTNKRKYYIFNDMVTIKNFASNLLQIGKRSYKDINIYYIGYITIKKMMIMKIFIV